MSGGCNRNYGVMGVWQWFWCHGGVTVITMSGGCNSDYSVMGVRQWLWCHGMLRVCDTDSDFGVMGVLQWWQWGGGGSTVITLLWGCDSNFGVMGCYSDYYVRDCNSDYSVIWVWQWLWCYGGWQWLWCHGGVTVITMLWGYVCDYCVRCVWQWLWCHGDMTVIMVLWGCDSDYGVLLQVVWILFPSLHGWPHVLCQSSWTSKRLQPHLLLPPTLPWVHDAWFSWKFPPSRFSLSFNHVKILISMSCLVPQPHKDEFSWCQPCMKNHSTCIRATHPAKLLQPAGCTKWRS